MSDLLHEAAERLDTLITLLELGAIDQNETAEVLRKSKITLDRLRNAICTVCGEVHDVPDSDKADESIESDPLYGQRMDSSDLGEN
ncbi:MAG: hypothetical protein ABSD76_20450 [Terriglobales bacterium]|jgi:hypothetical protein